MQNIKRMIAIILCVVMIGSVLPLGSFAAEGETEYTLYPIPQKITYQDGSYELKDINVIYGNGIDEATEARMAEVAALRELSLTEGTAADSAKTNVYVAINGSGDTVEAYIKANYTVDASLFTKTDAHFVASKDGEIVVLGKDVDSCFYGLTTVYQIFGQLTENSLRNFAIEDYADVASRGFIEGYYGNPWSTEDRINLMKWGGYYKLNSYFYAPKDDPKHNAKWRELYTKEEIDTLIKPLADAGNASKCRFVFALHPYMHNRIDHSTEASYQADLQVLKNKFMQVIEAGVRQIAILADDAANAGGGNYTRLLQDMTAWINELRAGDYPDLKLLLPFVTEEYMGYGVNYYKNFPENVQIVMTGGQVWGFCSPSFTNSFYNNVGRGVYLWINWPCTDNSKNHLIMGGYSDFLQVGVDPNKVQGIVLNPMQQSEPSKVAIFGNACYTWNIWETKEEADGAWETAFACVDHNTVVPDAASNALKELSKHMIDQTRFEDNPNVLEESVVLRHELSAFQNKLNAGTYTVADVDSLIEEFTILQNAAKTYRASGHEDIVTQIEPWLGNWDDTTVSVISYLNALKALKNNEGDDKVWGYYADGQAAYESSKNHPLWYLDHYEYAESGYRFIVPFMKALGAYLSEVAMDIVYPAGVPGGSGSGGATGGALRLTAFEGNYTGHYSGTVANVVDGNTSTNVWYNDYARVGQYIGVDMGKSVLVGKVNFTQDAGDHFSEYTLQYSTDGETYHDYKTYTDTVLNVDLSGTGIEARYLRFYSTATSSVWVKICEISVTEAASTGVDTNNAAAASWETRIGNETAELLTGGEATMAPGDYVGFDLRRIKDLSEITVTGQGDLTLQVSTNGVDWVDVTAGDVTEDGRYVRLINKTDADVSVNLTAFTVTSDEVAGPSLLESNIGVNSSWGVAEDSRENGGAFDGDVGTTTEFADFVAKDQYIIYDLGQTRNIRKLEIYSSDGAVNYIRDAKIQISADKNAWTDVITIGDGVENTGEASVTAKNSNAGYSQTTSSYPNVVSIEGTIEETPARYLRILMTAANNERAVLFNEIEINEGEYVSVSNDPTFEVSAIEAQGHAPQNMTDNDLTTSWKPDTDQGGSMVYTFSDNLTADRIHIVQKTISNAKVSLYAEKDGQRSWIDMGTLDKSLVALECENDLNLALKIEWAAGQTPNITEIVRFNQADVPVPEEPTVPTEPKPATVEVELVLGDEEKETATYTDNTGNYKDADTSALDTSVATVAITAVPEGYELGELATTLESGKQYVLVNRRANKPVFNEDVESSVATTANADTGLVLAGSIAEITEGAVWTVTGSGTTYTIQDANGKYMTLSDRNAGLTESEASLGVVFNGDYWTISQNNAYLNDSGQDATTAAGWEDGSASYDAGSKWDIYEANEKASSEITFTAVGEGETSVQIGNVIYNITVSVKETTPDASEPDASEPDASEPDASDPDASEPDASEPDASEPDASEPDASEPDASEPDASEPEYTVPECDKDDNCTLSQFDDIVVTEWYHDGIHFCVEEGIMNGMGEGKFAPTENTTRAQLVMMLYRLAGAPGIEGKTEPFSDVADTDWFYAPIVWAYENKVVNGVSDTEFAPNAGVTREQVATILYRYLDTPNGTGKLEDFLDAADVSGYAVDAMAWAVGEGLITGIAQADGTALLAPTGNATRAQIATILMRHLTK